MSKTLFITGASRGIGHEFVRQYLASGWRVVAGCRNPADLADLAATPALTVLQLDVTDWPAVAALPSSLGNTRIDLLINNAGIFGGVMQGLGGTDVGTWLNTLATNAIAPVKIVEALLPCLAPQAVIANISSRMGSMTDNGSGGDYHYRSAKAALNAATVSMARDLAGRHCCVALHPGWVRTAMGGDYALIDTATAVAGLQSVIAALQPADTGRFIAYDGRSIPW
ncbi:SDR family oxidoreductase [Jeongeupia chitinilytica]|uniref:Short-chain dehydrogenase n=1 Tax=Jeongeupia chitinilytica TaxID=1041641 RepID=A0ABQ3H1S1_9NEIS|nr:SDR family oxidoreductase [Jeongeupia chitinilytica]GHD63235.1 short-chain dehydrogenase [Jeongeupia chitinilytica]